MIGCIMGALYVCQVCPRVIETDDHEGIMKVRLGEIIDPKPLDRSGPVPDNSIIYGYICGNCVDNGHIMSDRQPGVNARPTKSDED